MSWKSILKEVAIPPAKNRELQYRSVEPSAIPPAKNRELQYRSVEPSAIPPRFSPFAIKNQFMRQDWGIQNDLNEGKTVIIQVKEGEQSSYNNGILTIGDEALEENDPNTYLKDAFKTLSKDYNTTWTSPDTVKVIKMTWENAIKKQTTTMPYTGPSTGTLQLQFEITHGAGESWYEESEIVKTMLEAITANDMLAQMGVTVTRSGSKKIR